VVDNNNNGRIDTQARTHNDCGLYRSRHTRNGEAIRW
jgi:hypothetical protein